MKTKIKEQIKLIEKRIEELRQQQSIAEKLSFHTQYSGFLQAIEELICVKDALNSIL